MSIANTIPKIWSARILENLRNNLVYANLFNRDYEGEIKNVGDTVKIFNLNDITVKKYTRNTDIEDPELLDSNELMLVIDQSNYFNFYVDKIDALQSKLELLDQASANAAIRLAEEVDTYLANQLTETITVSSKSNKATKEKNLIGTDTAPKIIDQTNAYEMLVQMKVALDKQNVPNNGRWVVVPPEFEGYMLLDPRFAYNTGASETRLVNGSVAKAAGFNIYISNNVPNTDGEKFKIVASYNGAATYAEQILDTEVYKPEKRFGNAVKGLHVFGSKVLRPDKIALLTANFTTGK
ncbi:MAG: P22 coat protein - protein 5 domain protein [Eubacteriales bacterium]|nr:P22 coat protein - protein 5 domain protein [Eubacteriales bacterium]